ncbi:MAG TPA: hypothetical protein VHJ82_04650, partial [Actinomycetota bacterium]|nr:hypothetical protein [Actinomycetota bacterium]
MHNLIQIGKLAAVVGGGAWTVKSLAIIAMNRHFQPLEGVLYFLGVGGIVVGAVGLSAFVAVRWAGAQRWVGFVVVLVAAVFITSLASSFIQTAVADAYSGDNVGIEEEMGILTPGLIWLAVGLFLLAVTRRRSVSISAEHGTDEAQVAGRAS